MNISNINGCRKETWIPSNKINSATGGGWFSNLKKSFKSCKNRKETKKVQTTKRCADNNSSQCCDDLTANTNNGEHAYFSNDFLDSFNSRISARLFYSNCFKSRYKDHGEQVPVNALHAKSNLLNAFFHYIEKNPSNMETTLSLVVEDYINGICEKMLHDKMRSVCRKIENWYKNPLARPGFKKSNSHSGGNFTMSEKYFEIPKSENRSIEPNIRRNELMIKGIKKVTETIQKSSTLDKRTCEKATKLSCQRRRSSSLSHSENNKGPAFSSINVNRSCVQENSRQDLNSKSYCDVSVSRDKSDSSMRVLSIRCTQNQSCQPKTVISNDSFSTSHDDGNTSKVNTNSNSSIKCNKELSKELKDPRTCKKVVKNKIPKDNGNCRINKVKILNISKIMFVNIKPLTEKKIDISSNDESRGELTLTVDAIEKSIIEANNKNNLLKMRRSVTFMEPRGCSLSSPLHREGGFCSNMDVRSTEKIPTLFATKSDELNYYLSSNTLNTVQQYDDSIIDLYHFSNGNNTFNPQELTFNRIRLDDTVDLNKEYHYNSLKNTDNVLNFPNNDNKIKSISAIVVSLQSTPTFPLDNNEKSKLLKSQDYFKNSCDVRNGYGKAANDEVVEGTTSENCLNYSIVDIENIIKSRGDESVWNKGGLNRYPTSPRQSEYSSSNSSLCDSEVIVLTDQMRSEVESCHFHDSQRVTMSVVNTNLEGFTSQPLFRPSIILSKMKTANFSSSSIMEESHMDTALKTTPSSHISFNSDGTKESDVFHAIATAAKPLAIQFQASEVENKNVTTEKIVQKKVYHHMLQHTVASKQKCRLKAPNKNVNYRQCMKFSTSLKQV